MPIPVECSVGLLRKSASAGDSSSEKVAHYRVLLVLDKDQDAGTANGVALKMTLSRTGREAYFTGNARRPSRILRNERVRNSASVKPVASTSSSVSAPQPRPRKK